MYDQYVPGDVIPSAAMNAAINQGVIPFANTAARDAALPAPTFGMMCQLQDTGTIQRWNGYVWVGDTDYVSATLVNGWAGNVKLKMDYLARVQVNFEVSHSLGTTSPVFADPSANYNAAPTIYFVGSINDAAASGYRWGSFFITTTLSVHHGYTALSDLVAAYGTLTYLANFLAVR